MVVAALVTVLLLAVAGWRAETGSAAKAAGEFVAFVEQARVTAQSKRRPVMVAIRAGEELQVALVELEAFDGPGVVQGRRLGKWHRFPDAVGLSAEPPAEGVNFLEAGRLAIDWDGPEVDAEVDALVVSPRGRLIWPRGSSAVAAAFEDRRGARSVVRVGRVVARPFHLEEGS